MPPPCRLLSIRLCVPARAVSSSVRSASSPAVWRRLGRYRLVPFHSQSSRVDDNLGLRVCQLQRSPYQSPCPRVQRSPSSRVTSTLSSLLYSAPLHSIPSASHRLGALLQHAGGAPEQFDEGRHAARLEDGQQALAVVGEVVQRAHGDARHLQVGTAGQRAHQRRHHLPQTATAQSTSGQVRAGQVRAAHCASLGHRAVVG